MLTSYRRGGGAFRASGRLCRYCVELPVGCARRPQCVGESSAEAVDCQHKEYGADLHAAYHEHASARADEYEQVGQSVGKHEYAEHHHYDRRRGYAFHATPPGIWLRASTPARSRTTVSFTHLRGLDGRRTICMARCAPLISTPPRMTGAGGRARGWPSATPACGRRNSVSSGR